MGLVAPSAAQALGALQQFERKSDQQAARRRRRVRENRRPAEIDGKRCTHLRPVARQVLCRQAPASGDAVFDDPPRHVAFVKQARPFTHQGVEKIRRLRISEPVAGGKQPPGRTLRREDRPRPLARRIDRPDDAEQVFLERGQVVSVAGYGQGRFDQPVERHMAELAMNPKQTMGQTGNGHGPEADVKFLLRRAEVGDDRIEIAAVRRRPLFRRLGEEIEQAGGFIGGPRQEKSAATERCQHRFGHGRGAHGAKGGIEGIATVAQNIRRSLCGQRISRRDGALSTPEVRRSRHHPFALLLIRTWIPALPGLYPF